MNPACIEEALFASLAAAEASLLPAVVYYPNAKNQGKPNPPTGTHIRAFILPAETLPVGVATTDSSAGIFQLSIFVKDSSGTMAAARLAGQILELYPRNTVLANGVRIGRHGSIAPGFVADGWYTLPVSIPYRVFTR